MKIRQIRIQNFRLLKDFSIDIQEDLSLIVGKNNVGKTSLLVALDLFLSKRKNKQIQYDDFNLDFQKELEDSLTLSTIEDKNTYKNKSIRLIIIVEYFDTDNLDNIGNKILTSLDIDNNYFALSFEYQLDYSDYQRMIDDFKNVQMKYKNKEHEYMLSNYQRFFKLGKQSIFVAKTENGEFIFDDSRIIKLDEVQGFQLDDVINFDFIMARRRVDNQENDNTLSEQTANLYKIREGSEEKCVPINRFKEKLKETDEQLTTLYHTIFEDIIGTISLFGGMHKKDTEIEVISTLQHKELLKGNTTVVYKQDNRNLPENYNGLGYMNLISILFEISLIIERMKRAKKRRPADLNLLFIEEPEAHTHPQMQYIFIKNIKSLIQQGIVGENKEEAQLQCIVSTHSSHIVAESKFDDIKYLKREGKNAVISKNLSDLKTLYITKDSNGNDNEDEKSAYRFLTQYLTLMNSELFFADKAIFVEGDTERILLPLMMQKIDKSQEPDDNKGELRLLSQNISVLPIGAHSHIFEKFFHFIGLTKLLIITDLDICAADEHHKKCPYIEGGSFVTSNAALKHYFNGDNNIANYINKTQEQKKLRWNEVEGKMSPDTEGNMMVCYQTKESEYQPRSFEDDFFKINADLMTKYTIEEFAIKQSALTSFKKDKNPYKLAEGVNSKAALAISLLIADNHYEWKVPTYIKEGLLWLRS